MADAIDRALNAMERDRDRMAEDCYSQHMRTRRARWLRWAARIADGDDVRAIGGRAEPGQ